MENRRGPIRAIWLSGLNKSYKPDGASITKESTMDKKDNVTTNPEERTGSLPSLASVFNPEEFFEMDAVEEVVLSRICCGSD
jgi:hypothetical protein